MVIVADVSALDYEVFVRQHERFTRLGSGEGGADRRMLDSLQTIRENSPGFVDAYLLESTVARHLYDVETDAKLLERARDVAERARAVAPNDPRPTDRLFDVSLREGDFEQARQAIEELRRLEPGSVEVLRREAHVARRSGEPALALDLMRRVVARRPARLYVQELADLEYEQGMYDEAKRTLEGLLSRFPDDSFTRSKLAEVELLYGSAEHAEELYKQIVEESSGEIEILNLGMSQVLLGKYDEAKAHFERLVRMSPQDPSAFLNLADCEKMAGRTQVADSLYRHVLTLLDQLEIRDRSVRAQCLAHIGERASAVALVQQLLQEEPENAWYYYAASLVYAIIGEPTSAVVNARQAAERGVTGRWFRLGLFDAVAQDTEFAKIVTSDPVATPQ